MELAQVRRARIVPRTGGRALADALVAQGIDHVFAVPGESYLDVLDGLYEVRQKLRLVTCRFEAGAVNMADAYGKLKGRPAAAMVTRGPGACHGAIGVLTQIKCVSSLSGATCTPPWGGSPAVPRRPLAAACLV